MDTEHAITWEVPPHEHTHKDPDWFWSIGIIATAIAVIAILGNNYLFALLIVIGTATLFIHAIKKPELVRVRITNRGVQVDEAFLPYKNLRSFCMHHDENNLELIIKPKQKISSSIIVPLDYEKENEVRAVFASRLKEEELEIPISYKVLQFLGL